MTVESDLRLDCAFESKRVQPKTKTNASERSEAETQTEGEHVRSRMNRSSVQQRALRCEGGVRRQTGWGRLGERRVTYRRLLHEAGPEPLSDATEVQVDAHQAELPSPLDELVGLHHQPLQDRRTGGETDGLKH